MNVTNSNLRKCNTCLSTSKKTYIWSEWHVGCVMDSNKTYIYMFHWVRTYASFSFVFSLGWSGPRTCVPRQPPPACDGKVWALRLGPKQLYLSIWVLTYQFFIHVCYIYGVFKYGKLTTSLNRYERGKSQKSETLKSLRLSTLDMHKLRNQKKKH